MICCIVIRLYKNEHCNLLLIRMNKAYFDGILSHNTHIRIPSNAGIVMVNGGGISFKNRVHGGIAVHSSAISLTWNALATAWGRELQLSL